MFVFFIVSVLNINVYQNWRPGFCDKDVLTVDVRISYTNRVEVMERFEQADEYGDQPAFRNGRGWRSGLGERTIRVVGGYAVCCAKRREKRQNFGDIGLLLLGQGADCVRESAQGCLIVMLISGRRNYFESVIVSLSKHLW